MTTPRIEEMVEEFKKRPLFKAMNDQQKRTSVGWLTQALTEAHQAGIDEAGERIKNWAEVYGTYTPGNLREEGKAETCRQLIKNLTTPPTSDDVLQDNK